MIYTITTTFQDGRSFQVKGDLATLYKIDPAMAETIDQQGDGFISLRLETDDSTVEVTKDAT